MSDFVSLAVQLAVMLACATLGGAVLRALRQPAVLGEMLGGVVLGPTILGAVAPGLQAELFPAAGPAAALRGGVVKLGMLLFMFTVGLEINPRAILQNGWTALGVGVMGTLVPLAAGVALVYALPGMFPLTGEATRFLLALFMGAAMANCANPVLARILVDLGLLKSRLGAIIMSATVIDDLMSWTLLFFVFERMAAAGGGAANGAGMAGAAAGRHVVELGGFLAATAVAGWAVSRFLARQQRLERGDVAARIGIVGVAVLLAAAAAEHLGLHAFLGPFVFGIAMMPPADDAEDEAYVALRRFVHGFFAPLYFVSLGLTTDFARHFTWPLVAAVTLVATASKIPAAYAGARFGGLDRRTSWAVGCGMNARGAIGIILANLGLDNRLIDEPTYVALVVMAIVTSLGAGPSMRACLGRGAEPAGAGEAIR
jgi:Kef-type K+ transport system membrane component KefB